MRLIDADALMRKLTVSPYGTRYREYDCDNFPATLTLIEVKKMVKNEPTVAEGNNVPVKQPDTMISLEWVKTTDRLPTKEDADDEGKVTALITGMLTGKLLSLSLYYASVTAESADYFLPMPKLPEDEK